MTLCPFCNNELPPIVEGAIEAIGRWCPSGCDSTIRVSVRCPSCKRVIYRKEITFPYSYNELVRLAERYGFDVETIANNQRFGKDAPYNIPEDVKRVTEYDYDPVIVHTQEGQSIADWMEVILEDAKDGLYLRIPGQETCRLVPLTEGV